eukprot:gene10532-biopygen247
MTRKALGSLSPGVTGQWRGHGAGVARAIGIYWVWVARAWRGHGAGVARACPVTEVTVVLSSSTVELLLLSCCRVLSYCRTVETVVLSNCRTVGVSGNSTARQYETVVLSNCRTVGVSGNSTARQYAMLSPPRVCRGGGPPSRSSPPRLG